MLCCIRNQERQWRDHHRGETNLITTTSPPPCRGKRRILFLDFDGVLHPQHESDVRPFGYMENFCNVLREAEADTHQTLEIVISSSWRRQETLEELRSHFPQDIATKIIGATPNLLPINPDLSGSRQREIEAWMAEHAPTAEWLALDDIEMYFEVDCPHLFLVDDDFPENQTATAGTFSLMAEIEERERLTALWNSRGLGLNLRVAEVLHGRLLNFLRA